MPEKVRCYYWGEANPLVNLGDSLAPWLLDALGFRAVGRHTPDSAVINPGRCLLVIGSLLTEEDIAKIGWPLDVWGGGWKGPGTEPSTLRDIRYYAVRGPHTRDSLHLPPGLVLGDPALLVPRLLGIDPWPDAGTLVIPHCFRLSIMGRRERLRRTGCDELLSPLVSPTRFPRTPRDLRGLGVRLNLWLKLGITTLDVRTALRRIAGASFVLSGSLHGAILAQAFGVPWACFDDGYVNAPAKWCDWGAYLGIDIETTHDLSQGQRWWLRTGRHGRLHDLDILLEAFPYFSNHLR